MKWKLSAIIIGLLLLSWSGPGTTQKNRSFSFKFCFGVDALNVLDTYNNIYTKDLIDAGTITVPFVLSDSEMQCINAKMTQIGIFNYPDTFVVANTGRIGVVRPYETYYFQVTYDSTVKRLYWADDIVDMDSYVTVHQDSTIATYHIDREDSATSKLRQLISLIEKIIASNPEYLKLPHPSGGYQ